MDGPGTKPNDHASALGTHHQTPIHLSIRQPIQTVRCAYNRKKKTQFSHHELYPFSQARLAASYNGRLSLASAVIIIRNPSWPGPGGQHLSLFWTLRYPLAACLQDHLGGSHFSAPNLINPHARPKGSSSLSKAPCGAPRRRQVCEGQARMALWRANR